MLMPASKADQRSGLYTQPAQIADKIIQSCVRMVRRSSGWSIYIFSTVLHFVIRWDTVFAHITILSWDTVPYNPTA